MRDTMIERVARALCVAHGGHPDEPVRIRDEVGGVASAGEISEFVPTHPAPRWTLHIERARAAIRALMEPTDGMVRAMRGAIRDDLDPTDDELRDFHRAALTAALEETPDADE